MTKLKKLNLLLAGILLGSSMTFQSCDNDDDTGSTICPIIPSALVTVSPWIGDAVFLQLDDSTLLKPKNMANSIFDKKKQVRALVNYTPGVELFPHSPYTSSLQEVTVNRLDTIRTKLPVKMTSGEETKFGNDPVEIVRDWVTVAEDGFLTLRLRTARGDKNHPHKVDLVYHESAVGQKGSSLTVELRHDAGGDLSGPMGDALIAFDLNELAGTMKKPVSLTVKWNSFSGEKSTEFTLGCRKPSPIN